MPTKTLPPEVASEKRNQQSDIEKRAETPLHFTALGSDYCTSISGTSNYPQRCPPADGESAGTDFSLAEAAFQRAPGNHGIYPISPTDDFPPGKKAEIADFVVHRLMEARISQMAANPRLEPGSWHVTGTRSFRRDVDGPVLDAYIVRNTASSGEMVVFRDDDEWTKPGGPNRSEGSIRAGAARLLLMENPDWATGKNKAGDTPLHIAALNGSDEVAKLLLDHNSQLARIANDRGQTPLHLAVFNGGDIDIVKSLAAALDEPTMLQADHDGNNLLHMACFGAHLFAEDQMTIVDWLAERYPRLASQTNRNGATPLHVAASVGRKDLVSKLIAAAPETVNMRDADGDTPLHVAAMKDVTTVVLGKASGGGALISVEPMTRLGEDLDNAAALLYKANPELATIENNHGFTANGLVHWRTNPAMKAVVERKYISRQPENQPDGHPANLKSGSDSPNSDNRPHPSQMRRARRPAHGLSAGDWGGIALVGSGCIGLAALLLTDTISLVSVLAMALLAVGGALALRFMNAVTPEAHDISARSAAQGKGQSVARSTNPQPAISLDEFPRPFPNGAPDRCRNRLGRC